MKSLISHETNNVFMLGVDELQPSQFYINLDKLKAIERQMAEQGADAFDPIPVRRVLGRICMTDGHTRAFLFYHLGFKEVKVELETYDLDWDEYEIYVSQCIDCGIKQIKDLKIINNVDYQKYWLEYCKAIRELFLSRSVS